MYIHTYTDICIYSLCLSSFFTVSVVWLYTCGGGAGGGREGGGSKNTCFLLLLLKGSYMECNRGVEYFDAQQICKCVINTNTHTYTYKRMNIIYVDAHTYTHTHEQTKTKNQTKTYGVASVSRLLEIIGLFCKRAL